MRTLTAIVTTALLLVPYLFPVCTAFSTLPTSSNSVTTSKLSTKQHKRTRTYSPKQQVGVSLPFLLVNTQRRLSFDNNNNNGREERLESDETAQLRTGSPAQEAEKQAYQAAVLRQMERRQQQSPTRNAVSLARIGIGCLLLLGLLVATLDTVIHNPESSDSSLWWNAAGIVVVGGALAIELGGDDKQKETTTVRNNELQESLFIQSEYTSGRFMEALEQKRLLNTRDGSDDDDEGDNQ